MNTNQKIIKYDTEVDKYIKKLGSSKGTLEETKKHGYEKYSFVLDKLEKFYHITNYISSKGYELDDNEKILFTLFSKASLDVWGIYYCLSNGLEVQASILLRSLFEVLVTVKVILKENTLERLRLYTNYSHIERWNHIKLHKEMSGKGYSNKISFEQSEIDNIIDNFNKYKTDYHPQKPIHWAYKEFRKNPTMKDLCEYLGDEFVNNYIFIFGTGSKFVHVSPILEGHFTHYQNEKRLIVNSFKFTDSTINVSCLAMNICCEVITEILNFLKVQDYEDTNLYIRFFTDQIVHIGHNYLEQNS